MVSWPRCVRTPGERPAVTGERFIPFRKTSVITMCVDDLPAQEREAFRAFADLLASLLHHEFRTRLEALKDAYHPFNPDTDTRTIVELGPAERQAAQQRLVDELAIWPRTRTSCASTPTTSAARRRGVADEGPAGGRLRRLRADGVLPRGEHTRHEEVKTFSGSAVGPSRSPNTEGSRLCEIKEAAYFEAHGKKVDRLPFTPGSTSSSSSRTSPRRPGDAVPQRTGTDAPHRQSAIGVPAIVSGSS